MRHPATPILNALTYRPERTLLQTPDQLGLQYTDVSSVTADGETLHGWWVPARDPIGHVLFAHGNAGNIGDQVSLMAMLVEAGFDALVFDYRGYGRSTGKPSEHGTYLDARAARETLLAQPGVHADRVLYLGESLGGGIVLELAQRYPPAGLMVMSTFTGLRDAAHGVYPLLPAALIPNAYPNLQRIGRVRAPVLIMHGDQDELLPLPHAHALYAAAPEPKRLVVFPGAGHGEVATVGGSEWYGLVRDWAGALVRQ
ncbi:alpha/beta hydrolase [Nocardia sp. CNY236]|uniref:alpha/beta hydrolase n=1 Tax=Nocardia sp. CNY236 TaxID=1169152 RepID=UPI00048B077F|nr:alpha/beta hydrolase [Nocardia sp. CNY236]